uniref:Aminotransferase putative n=1 Tax=Albugo laibachii Nc14 TaxID=890382 RepID=F0W754_9STRA|nr:aminotransferase putative [Albugo laibachii Nc14]|eukprot:CCA16953.1 aminotransferase putative [Albugo laibachii Nc14]
MERCCLTLRLEKSLQKRRKQGTYRELREDAGSYIDFSTNDYLGFAQSCELCAFIASKRNECKVANLGSTGSRLLSGNSAYCMEVERSLARFYRAEDALLFNSGYTANLGVLSCLPSSEDWVLYDELIHNSSLEGIRLSRALRKPFRHNDTAHLEELLSKVPSSKNAIFIVVESIYSMDGDEAPVMELVRLCRKYRNAYVIIDEAHGVGVCGDTGAGLLEAKGLLEDVNSMQRSSREILCCRIYTFGKAMGIHGAVVCGSQTMIRYLVNYARSFIYTTSLPPEHLVTIHYVHEFCKKSSETRNRLQHLVRYFRDKVIEESGIPPKALLHSVSAIQGVLIDGNEAVSWAVDEMKKRGLMVYAIRAPTVRRGKERIRINLHAHNTEVEIDQLVKALAFVFVALSKPKSRI